MIIFKSVAFFIAALIGILLTGLLLVIIPVLLPEARPYYAQGWAMIRRQFTNSIMARNTAN